MRTNLRDCRLTYDRRYGIIELAVIVATQPNEIIYHGTIRNGRNATIIVEKNDFE